MVKRISSLIVCCAFLWTVGAGLFLLFYRFFGAQAPAAPGVYTADQSFPLYLLSVGNVLRIQLHTTWLFLAAFAALGMAGLLWVMAEKWQQKSKWKRQEVYWMAGFGTVLCSSAILYGIGTNGVMPRKFAASVTISDVLGVGLVLAVPVLLWSRWRKLEVETDGLKHEKERPGSRYSRSLLGLEEGPSSAPLIEHAPQPPPTAFTPDASRVMAEPAIELLQAPLSAQLESPESNFSDQSEQTSAQSGHIVTLAAEETGGMEAMSIVGAASDTTAQEVAQQENDPVPAAGFRERLAALNTSWQKIEETGKEVEEWFRWQQERVVAHLERNAGKQAQPLPFDFSRDFLEQKMRRVDEEWIMIHQAVREMNLWLESSSPHKEQGEVSKAG